MLEPGLEHILSDDERVGCETSRNLEPTDIHLQASLEAEKYRKTFHYWDVSQIIYNSEII